MMKKVLVTTLIIMMCGVAIAACAIGIVDDLFVKKGLAIPPLLSTPLCIFGILVSIFVLSVAVASVTQQLTQADKSTSQMVSALKYYENLYEAESKKVQELSKKLAAKVKIQPMPEPPKPKKKVKLTPNEKLVLRTLKRRGAMRPTNLGVACDKHRDHAASWACKVLKRLVLEGLVEKTEKKGKTYYAAI